MKNNVTKIKRRVFYNLGGFANPRLFRKANKNGVWSYYYDDRQNNLVNWIKGR